ncbi:unnamed protein product [Rhizophagus irregularis]|nr:unnamed protein product [Rhizophagus irregularis]
MNENCAIFNDHTYGPSFGGADLVLWGNSGHCIKDSYEKQIRCPSSESVLHYGATCDCCNYTIRGMGWECTNCEDYVLCQVCKPQSYIHHHPNDHVFELMQHSESSDRAPQFALHDGIVYCKSKSSNIHDHPNNHAFQPIGYPEFKFDIEESNPAICDYCESSCVLAVCRKCANGEFCVEEYEIFQVIKR